MVFLREFFENIDFEKIQQMTKKIMKNYPACKELRIDMFRISMVFSLPLPSSLQGVIMVVCLPHSVSISAIPRIDQSLTQEKNWEYYSL